MFELSTSDARPDTELHRCACGVQCRAAVRVDGVKIPARTEAAYAACDECVRGFEWAFTDITETWIALHAAIGDHTRRAGQKVSGSRSAPINLNTDVDALKMAILEWLVAAAARVAESLNVDDPQPLNHTDKENYRVVLACSRLIAPNVEKLLGLPAEEVTIWTPPTETDYPGESLPCSVSPTGYRPNTTEILCTGVDIALKVSGLRSKARALLSLTNEKLALPCPVCNRDTLRRTSTLAYTTEDTDTGEFDKAKCSECGKEWGYSHYQNLCEIWVQEDEMQRDRLQQELDEVKARCGLAEWLLAEREWQFGLALACTDIPASVFASTVVFTVHDVKEYKSVRDLAVIVNVAESTIRGWAAEGKITKHVAGDGSLVFEAKEVWDMAKTARRNTKATA